MSKVVTPTPDPHNPPPLLFVVMHNPYTASHNNILLSLYGRYLAMHLDCDDTRQAVKVSCSFAAFSGS